jgi:predicted nucleotidyltransferase
MPEHDSGKLPLESSHRKILHLLIVPDLGIIIPNMGTDHDPVNLASALFSRTQARVLGLLFSNPDRGFQVTEIIRLANSGRGAVQRELEKLTEAGILDTDMLAGRKIYKASRSSPIFDELRGLVIKTIGVLEPLRKALEPCQSRIDVAFIYGSVATGKDTAQSDIDLMIIGEELAYAEVYAALQKAEQVLQRVVNPNLMTAEEWRENIAKGSPFLKRILGQSKLFLIGTESDLARIG